MNYGCVNRTGRIISVSQPSTTKCQTSNWELPPIDDPTSASTKSYWHKQMRAAMLLSLNEFPTTWYISSLKNPQQTHMSKDFSHRVPHSVKIPMVFFQLYLRFQFTKNSTTNPLRSAAVTFSWGESVGRETTGATLKSRCRITSPSDGLLFCELMLFVLGVWLFEYDSCHVVWSYW